MAALDIRASYLICTINKQQTLWEYTYDKGCHISRRSYGFSLKIKSGFLRCLIEVNVKMRMELIFKIVNLRVVDLFKFLIQFGIASILLLISTVAGWYEGSAILDNPWEWKYSTPFSQLLSGQVHSDSDISQLDYFIYAAKFRPTFPVIMVISSLYLLILIGYYFLKRQYKSFSYYLFFLGGGSFLLSYFIFNSPTVGGRIFFYIWLVSGVLCTVTAVVTYFQIFNRNANDSTN